MSYVSLKNAGVSPICETKATVHYSLSTTDSWVWVRFSWCWSNDGITYNNWSSTISYFLRHETITRSFDINSIEMHSTFHWKMRITYDFITHPPVTGTFVTLNPSLTTGPAEKHQTSNVILRAKAEMSCHNYVSYKFNTYDPQKNEYKTLCSYTGMNFYAGINSVYCQWNSRTVGHIYYYNFLIKTTSGDKWIEGGWRQFLFANENYNYRAFIVDPSQNHYFGETKSFTRPWSL
jgi:hypothetical protein